MALIGVIGGGFWILSEGRQAEKQCRQQADEGCHECLGALGHDESHRRKPWWDEVLRPGGARAGEVGPDEHIITSVKEARCGKKIANLRP